MKIFGLLLSSLFLIFFFFVFGMAVGWRHESVNNLKLQFDKYMNLQKFL